jgi:hypothetical protein
VRQFWGKSLEISDESSFCARSDSCGCGYLSVTGRMSGFGGDFDMAELIGRRCGDAALDFLRAIDAREVV